MATKVWVAMSCVYRETPLRYAVFSSKKKAEKWCESELKKSEVDYTDFWKEKVDEGCDDD